MWLRVPVIDVTGATTRRANRVVLGVLPDARDVDLPSAVAGVALVPVPSGLPARAPALRAGVHSLAQTVARPHVGVPLTAAEHARLCCQHFGSRATLWVAVSAHIRSSLKLVMIPGKPFR